MYNLIVFGGGIHHRLLQNFHVIVINDCKATDVTLIFIELVRFDESSTRVRIKIVAWIFTCVDLIRNNFKKETMLMTEQRVVYSFRVKLGLVSLVLVEGVKL